MKRNVTLFALAAALTACGGRAKESTSKPSAPVVVAARRAPSQAELVGGPLPGGPEGTLVRAKCTICHTEAYLIQQRLSPDSWHRTLVKMQKFGAPLSDKEVATLAAWLSGMYTPQLPVRPGTLVELPAVGFVHGS